MTDFLAKFSLRLDQGFKVYMADSFIMVATPLQQSCSRYLETKDLDLRDALFVQFDLEVGCVEDEARQGVLLLQGSCDAGLTWTTLKKLRPPHRQPS